MPVAKNPKKKDSVRKAQNKYQLANFKVVGCKLPKAYAEAFAEKTKQNGSSVNAVLLEMIKKYMEE